MILAEQERERQIEALVRALQAVTEHLQRTEAGLAYAEVPRGLYGDYGRPGWAVWPVIRQAADRGDLSIVRVWDAGRRIRVRLRCGHELAIWPATGPTEAPGDSAA